jgi:hypothetical protein
MAGMTKRPFLAIRMIVDVLVALSFILAGLGGIHYPDSWVVNFGSVALCLLVAAGFFIDFSYTKRRIKKGTTRENRGKGVKSIIPKLACNSFVMSTLLIDSCIS